MRADCPRRTTKLLPWVVLCGCLAAVAWGCDKPAEDPAADRRALPKTLLKTSQPTHVADVSFAHADTGPNTIDDARIGPKCASNPGKDDLSHAGYDYRYFRPEVLGRTEQIPVFVFFHGGGRTPAEHLAGGLGAFAQEHRVAVIAPLGTDVFAWPLTPPALGWVREILDKHGADDCLDLENVWVWGDDTGGTIAEELACEPWVRAVITSNYRPNNDLIESCGDRAVARLLISPTASMHIPLAGGVDCSFGIPHIPYDDHVEVWSDKNGCGKATRPYPAPDGAKCSKWRTCEAPMVACQFEGGQQWSTMAARTHDLFQCDGPIPKANLFEVVSRFFDETPHIHKAAD